MTAILGIHDGHDASAALMINGEIAAAAQEERFTGLKGDYGYPKLSVDFCLKHCGLKPKDIDHVALSSRVSNPVLTYIKRNANFSVSDWIDEQEKFWKFVKLENKKVNYFDIYKNRPFKFDKYYNFDGIISGYMTVAEMEEFLKRRLDFISKELSHPKDKIIVTNHETNHKCYALFSSKFRDEPVLILTVEGIGDEYNATVSVYKDGEIQTICNMKECHLGHLYQYTTLILGMKPAQHEYKVMGLAPYSNDYETAKAYKVYRKILKVDGLEIKFDKKPADLFYAIRHELMDCRFDGIAGGMQKCLEDVLCEWVANCVKHTGVRKLVMAGGVAQNIKAMKSISELDCIDDMFTPPAAGDTSNCVGACYSTAYQISEKSHSAHKKISPLKNIYLGPAFGPEEIEKCLEDEKVYQDFNVTKGVKNIGVARLLQEGKIVGMCRGRMEFGLRALGNRTIMADPSNPQTLDRINQKIKFRDFWMPFTPSMLDYRAKDYIVNPKNLYSPFMTMAFPSVEENRADFPAAMHPADKSVRPQIVSKDMNPEYYALIQEFEKLTGRGVILNTSFNLHGKPVVLGPCEAVFTLKNSGLDALVIEDYLIERK
jgi:carbamoyltransferase